MIFLTKKYIIIVRLTNKIILYFNKPLIWIFNLKMINHSQNYSKMGQYSLINSILSIGIIIEILNY